MMRPAVVLVTPRRSQTSRGLSTAQIMAPSPMQEMPQQRRGLPKRPPLLAVSQWKHFPRVVLRVIARYGRDFGTSHSQWSRDLQRSRSSGTHSIQTCGLQSGLSARSARLFEFSSPTCFEMNENEKTVFHVLWRRYGTVLHVAFCLPRQETGDVFSVFIGGTSPYPKFQIFPSSIQIDTDMDTFSD